MVEGADDTRLHDVLARARELKFLGPSPLPDQIDNGDGFTSILADLGARTIVDLGSGGGVPALVVAHRLPEAELTLVERGRVRADFLRWAIAEMNWQNRCHVICGEAEDVARARPMSADAVTARSFAPPAVTAECACRFLLDDGALVVSEPPDEPTRWSTDALVPLGLGAARRIIGDHGVFVVVPRDPSLPIDDRYPRRPGRARRDPLF